MKKWTYLVATLFLGATVAFTSCVNTDEPEGIKEMRGAKAELLRAKALVAQAEATAKAAEATLTQAQAEVQKAIAEVQKAQAEAQRAQTQIDKDKAAVELQKLQAEAEAKIAEYEANAAKQQLAYEKTMRELEALALTLTKEEQNAITSWKTFADNANRKLQSAEGTLEDAQEKYYNAVVDDSYISESVQEANVAKLQLQADQTAKAYAIQEGLLASLKETAPVEWDQILRDLNDSIYAAKVAMAATEVAVTEYYRSEEFQAYEQAFLAAIEAQGQYESTPGKFKENGKYRKAAISKDDNGKKVEKSEFTGTKAALKAARKAYNEAANAEIALEKYDFSVNPAVKFFIEKAQHPDFRNGAYEYPANNYSSLSSINIEENKWKLAAYLNDVEALAEDEDYSATDPMFDAIQRLNAYRNALDEFEIDPNGQEWLKLDLPDKEKKSLAADTAYMEAVALWQIQADIVAKGDYSGVDFAAYAKDLKELIDGQNAAYTAYAAGVAKYDTLVWALADSVNAVREAAIDAAIAADKQKAVRAKFIALGYGQLPESSASLWSQNDWKNGLGKTEGPLVGIQKDSVGMATFLKHNHDADDSRMSVEAVLAAAKKEVENYFTEAKIEQLTLTSEKYMSKSTDLGIKDDVWVGVYDKWADGAVETWLGTDAKKKGQKLVTEIDNLLISLGNEELNGTTEKKLIDGYKKYDNWAIKTKWDKNFSTKMYDEYGLLTVDSLKTKFNNLIGYNCGEEAAFDNSVKEVLSKLSKKDEPKDSIVVINLGSTVKNCTIYTAVDKSISDEAFATMTKIEKPDQTQAEKCLATYSKDAFGTGYDWKTGEKARLINEIEDKLLADCQKEYIADNDNNESTFETKFGDFGKKYWNNYWYSVCANYQVAGELKQVDVDSLDAQIARMQAAVEAAKVPYEPLEAALEEAKAANKAALEAIDAAEAERNAQMAAQEELVAIADANVNEWGYQEANLKKAITDIAEGKDTVEKYLNAQELALANKKIKLEEANEAVVEAQKVLDMIKAGTYSYEFGVQQAESALERAQANYDIAAAEYQAALAKLAEVLATLVGE